MNYEIGRTRLVFEPHMARRSTCDSAVVAASSVAVSRSQASRDDDDPSTTLGDLLYADPSAKTISEEDWVCLVRSIAAGDQEALRSLYQRTHRLVFTLAMRICNSRENAEEVTVDVFHDVWRRSAQYDPNGGSVVGWIMNQARSRAIDRVRFEQRKKRVAPSERQDGHVELAATAVDVDAEAGRRLLQAALTSLTRDERDAVETAFFSELSYSETAARLGQPLGTVKTRIRSALAKLRKAVKGEEGGR